MPGAMKWIEFGGAWDNGTPGSFVRSKLNRPGTIIERADGTHLLIGDINVDGGVCDCCSGIMDGEIVVRYAPKEED